MENEMDQSQETYVQNLMKERDSIDPSCTTALQYINQEIERAQNGGNLNGQDDKSEKSSNIHIVDVSKPKPIKLQMKVMVPVKEHPNFNFVGKLLGPKGLSLKRLQEESMTKMAILGKGSMRDKAKEAELRTGGDPKYSHLNEELHVDISAYAPAADAYARMANALEGIKKFLVPDYYDDIRSQQLQELAIMNGGNEKMMRGGMKGGAPPIAGRPPRQHMQQDQSQWVSLAAPPPQRTSTPRGRGARGGPRGPARGGPRGAMRGGRGGTSAPPRRPVLQQNYGYDEGYAGADQGYDESSYGQGGNDGGFYDYTHDESFQETGAGDYSQDYTEDWNPSESAPRMKSDPSGAGGPMRRGGMNRGSFRNQPYAAQSFGASRY